MKKNLKKMIPMLLVLMMLFTVSMPVFAAGETADDKNAVATTASSADADTETETEDSTKGDKALAAAIAVGLAAAAGALGMGWAIAKSAEGISRQPEAEGKIRTTLMLGLVFIETAIIYALVIAILIIFVL